MKKIIAGLGMAAITLALTGTAFAASINSVNDSSVANILARWFARITVNTSNSAALTNSISATAGTGTNLFTSADDQTGTTLVTGSASAASVVDNTANSNSLSESLESADGTGAAISSVNDESTADITTRDRLINDVTDTNSISADNAVVADAQSGFNTFESGDSLTSTSATTGATEAATGISNLFNFNVKEIIRTIRVGL